MTREEPRYLNDHWTLEDELGIAGVGDHVARIALEAPPPFVIGVTGKWGAGKTSILRRAFATLGGEPIKQAVPLGENRSEEREEKSWERWLFSNTERSPYLGWNALLTRRAEAGFFVWYSPWQHQGADNPVVPLLLEIKEQFSRLERFKAAAQDVNRRGGLAAIALLERAVDAAASLFHGRSVQALQGSGEAVRRAWREAAPEGPSLTDGQRFHLLFEDAVETVLAAASDEEGDGQRLVIFIDDLDRCEGAVVVELLESIKLYLNTHRCVFVFGMDDAAVLDALKERWPKRGDDGNREYLEKLFQAIVPVPAPSWVNTVSYIEGVLKQHRFPAVEMSAPQIQSLLEPNPRKIKNFLNSLCAIWSIAGGGDDESEGLRFILFHYLRLYHRSVWRLLERQPALLGLFLATLIGVEENGIDPYVPSETAAVDQRMFRQFVLNDFFHVLSHRDSETFQEKHLHLSLSDAVERFADRLDRKRSDETFIKMFFWEVDQENWSSVADWLMNRFLQLSSPVIPETDS